MFHVSFLGASVADYDSVKITDRFVSPHHVTPTYTHHLRSPGWNVPIAALALGIQRTRQYMRRQSPCNFYSLH